MNLATATMFGLLAALCLFPSATADEVVCEPGVACIHGEVTTDDGVGLNSYVCIADAAAHTTDDLGIEDGSPSGGGSVWIGCPPPPA